MGTPRLSGLACHLERAIGAISRFSASCGCAIVVALLCPAPCSAQFMIDHDQSSIRLRALHGPGGRKIRRSFESDQEATSAFKEILNATGIPGLADRIALRASAETANAEAQIGENGQRFIFYNVAFIQELKSRSGRYWSLVFVVAHEVGHHIAGHLDFEGQNHRAELEADRYAGFMLGRMGASYDEAVAAVATLGTLEATDSHPSRDHRLQAVILGWSDGARQTNSRPSDSPNTERQRQSSLEAPRDTPRAPSSAERNCGNAASFACIQAGAVAGLSATNLRNLSCGTERSLTAVAIGWKDIWTTSVYSYAPGGGGPGGGLENDALRIGGWGDLYFSLLRFETPRMPIVKFAALLLHSKADEGTPTEMALDRITQPWGWNAGDRLWWKDRPQFSSLAAKLPMPHPQQWYFIDITTTVQDWQREPSSNFGLQLRPLSNNQNYSTFHSSRSADASKRPRLLICT